VQVTVAVRVRHTPPYYGPRPAQAPLVIAQPGATPAWRPTLVSERGGTHTGSQCQSMSAQETDTSQ